MKRYLLPISIFGAFLGLFTLLFVGLNIDTKHVRSPLIGKPAPTFSAPRLLDDTRKISNKDFTGHIVVLNIWASWCTTCYLEHPFLMKLAQNKQIRLYGLNYKDTRFAAKKMLKDKGNPYYAVAFDPNGDIGIAYGITAVPETFIIDKQGIIRFKHFGAITLKVWNEKMLPLIQKLNR